MSDDAALEVLSSIGSKLDTIYNLVGYQTAIEYIILVLIVAYLLCKFYYFVLAMFESI